MEEIVRESISSNEDEREEAELKIRERGLDLEQSESQEEKDYKAEFFELLDEVKCYNNYQIWFVHRFWFGTNKVFRPTRYIIIT